MSGAVPSFSGSYILHTAKRERRRHVQRGYSHLTVVRKHIYPVKKYDSVSLSDVSPLVTPSYVFLL